LSLFRELKRRKVFTVGFAYLVIAWMVAQVLQLVFESFGTPDWMIKTALVLLAVGFPFALFLACGDQRRQKWCRKPVLDDLQKPQ
jgi:uncharacterized membrane protein YcjF (UPF0283 family)